MGRAEQRLDGKALQNGRHRAAPGGPSAACSSITPRALNCPIRQFAMDHHRLQALLGAAHSPAAPPAQRQAAEAELQALARSPAALEWALAALAAPQLEAAARFFACAVVDEAAAHSWARLPPQQQAAVRAALWAGVADRGAPHFQRAKLAATLAHAAAIDGPEAWLEFLPALQGALADPARREPALDLLGATLDTLHALSQATAAGLRGKASFMLPLGCKGSWWGRRHLLLCCSGGCVHPCCNCCCSPQLHVKGVPQPPLPPPHITAGALRRRSCHPAAVPRPAAPGPGHALLPAAAAARRPGRRAAGSRQRRRWCRRRAGRQGAAHAACRAGRRHALAGAAGRQRGSSRGPAL